MLSKFLSVKWKELGDAALYMVITTLLLSMLPILQDKALPTLAEIKGYLEASIAAGLAFVIKTLLSNSEGQFLKREK